MPQVKESPQFAAARNRFAELGKISLVLMLITALVVFLTLVMSSSINGMAAFMAGILLLVGELIVAGAYGILAVLNIIAIIGWLRAPNRQLQPRSEIYLGVCVIQVIVAIWLITLTLSNNMLV